MFNTIRYVDAKGRDVTLEFPDNQFVEDWEVFDTPSGERYRLELFCNKTVYANRILC